MSKIAEQLLPLAVSIDKIRTDPKNGRSHSDTNINAIKRSLEVYGQRKPIVVNRNTGIIEAGNGLYTAAKYLGWRDIAAVYIEDDEQTSAAYGLTDNQTALLADWNLPNLKDIVLELERNAFDLSLLGFPDKEIEDLLNPICPERNMSSQLSRGYVEGIDEIDTLKLAYRLESICNCQKRDMAIDLFSGQGRLAFWYKRLFRNVIRVDKEHFDGVDFNQKAEIFLREHLKDYMNFDFIDFDDEGCPGKELQLFFALIEGRRKPFTLCLTDGMGLALKVRARVNLFEKYLYGPDEVLKIKDDSQYRDFDRYVKHLVNTLCDRHGFYNKVLNWYRGAEGNVIYAGFEIYPS